MKLFPVLAIWLIPSFSFADPVKFGAEADINGLSLAMTLSQISDHILQEHPQCEKRSLDLGAARGVSIKGDYCCRFDRQGESIIVDSLPKEDGVNCIKYKITSSIRKTDILNSLMDKYGKPDIMVEEPDKRLNGHYTGYYVWCADAYGANQFVMPNGRLYPEYFRFLKSFAFYSGDLPQSTAELCRGSYGYPYKGEYSYNTSYGTVLRVVIHYSSNGDSNYAEEVLVDLKKCEESRQRLSDMIYQASVANQAVLDPNSLPRIVSPVSDSWNKPQIAVANVRLGMSPDEAEAQLKSFQSWDNVNRIYSESRGPGSATRQDLYTVPDDLLYLTGVRAEKNNSQKDETITIWISPTIDNPRVIAVERSVRFLDSSISPTMNAFQNDLVQNYSGLGRPVIDKNNDSCSFRWIFDAKGLISADLVNLMLTQRPGGFYASSNGVVNLPASTSDCKAGDGIALKSYSVSFDSNTNIGLVGRYSISLYDGDALSKAYEQAMATAATLQSRAQQKALNDANKNPTKF